MEISLFGFNSLIKWPNAIVPWLIQSVTNAVQRKGDSSLDSNMIEIRQVYNTPRVAGGGFWSHSEWILWKELHVFHEIYLNILELANCSIFKLPWPFVSCEIAKNIKVGF